MVMSMQIYCMSWELACLLTHIIKEENIIGNWSIKVMGNVY